MIWISGTIELHCARFKRENFAQPASPSSCDSPCPPSRCCPDPSAACQSLSEPSSHFFSFFEAEDVGRADEGEGSEEKVGEAQEELGYSPKRSEW